MGTGPEPRTEGWCYAMKTVAAILGFVVGVTALFAWIGWLLWTNWTKR